MIGDEPKYSESIVNKSLEKLVRLAFPKMNISAVIGLDAGKHFCLFMD